MSGKINERVEMLTYSPRYYTNTTIQQNKISLFVSLTSVSVPHHKKHKIYVLQNALIVK
jgi:hypothetical protein